MMKLGAWLESLPAGWTIAPVKALARPGYRTFVDGDWIETPHITDQGVRLIQTGNIGVGRYREQGFRFVSEETFRALRCTEVEPGDILICRLAEPVGRACLAPDLGAKAITSVDVAILKTRADVDARFVVYAMSSPTFLQEIDSIVRGGTRGRISRTMLGAVPLPVPPTSVQTAIANFLDRRTAAIDALIEKKERLMELLQEKRQALITQAVTKGLDPTVPMKDSGIEWLGEIPAHWEVKRFSHIVGVRSGQVDPSESGNSALPLYAPNHVEPKTGRLLAVESAEEQGSISGKYAVRKGDVIYSKIRPALAKAMIAPADGLCSADMYVLEPSSSQLAPHFLLFTLLSDWFISLTVLESARVAMPKINRDSLGALKLVVPPLEEQERIVAAVNQGLGALDKADAGLRKSVELLQEYRQAIITAAVTGQLDVAEQIAHEAEAVA